MHGIDRTRNPMASEHCHPCAAAECLEVTDGEAAALKTLYQRMLDKQPEPPVCGPVKPTAPYDKSDACLPDGSESVLKRFDALMTATLDSRSPGGAGPGADDKAVLPDPVLFAKCSVTPAGSVNTSLYGLDVERAVMGPPAERDGLVEAAESLMKAEAACKHGGAVRAAEIAALAQPEPKHAEDAARIGAKAYSAAATGGKPGGSTVETPVEVVGYVGCTKPPPDVVKPKTC